MSCTVFSARLVFVCQAQTAYKLIFMFNVKNVTMMITITPLMLLLTPTQQIGLKKVFHCECESL